MNKNILHISFFLSVIICFYNNNARAQRVLTLEQVISLAQQLSPAARIALANKNSKRWAYIGYKSNLLPQLSINSTAPDFNRSISSITQPDGTLAFRAQSLSNYSMGLTISQNIWPTNSQFYVSSNLQRLDVFNQNATSTNYLANPAILGIRQPLFAFNQLKWDKRIQPLLYKESLRLYYEELENVSLQASQQFFSLLLAQMNLDIAKRNVANNDTLFKISKGRYNLGKIAENELLQMELNMMNASNSYNQALIDLQQYTFELKRFLNIQDTGDINLLVPELLPKFEVNEQLALQYAQKNRQKVIEFERQRLEAAREVERARRNARFSGNISASYGLTQSQPILNDVFSNPQDQQRASLSFNMPIIDWGNAKSQIKQAKAAQEIAELQVEQSQQNFEQEILLLVKQIKLTREKLMIAYKSDTIGQKRYDIAIKRYLIGKIGITDLNIAQQEKDNSRQNFVSALRGFWTAYFDLRRKTLYDFEKGADLLKQ